MLILAEYGMEHFLKFIDSLLLWKRTWLLNSAEVFKEIGTVNDDSETWTMAAKPSEKVVSLMFLMSNRSRLDIES